MTKKPVKKTLQALATKLSSAQSNAAQWGDHREQALEALDIVLDAISALSADKEAEEKIDSTPRSATRNTSYLEYCTDKLAHVGYVAGWTSCISALLNSVVEATGTKLNTRGKSISEMVKAAKEMSRTAAGILLSEASKLLQGAPEEELSGESEVKPRVDIVEKVVDDINEFIVEIITIITKAHTKALGGEK